MFVPAPTMFEVFKENPLPFVLALATATAGVVCAIIGVALSRHRARALVFACAAGVLGILAVASGAWGRASHLHYMEVVTSASGLTDEDRSRLRAYGDGEANMFLQFGAEASALPILLAMAAAAAGLARGAAPPR